MCVSWWGVISTPVGPPGSSRKQKSVPGLPKKARPRDPRPARCGDVRTALRTHCHGERIAPFAHLLVIQRKADAIVSPLRLAGHAGAPMSCHSMTTPSNGPRTHHARFSSAPGIPLAVPSGSAVSKSTSTVIGVMRKYASMEVTAKTCCQCLGGE